MGRCGARATGKGKFGSFLASKMIEQNCTVKRLAEKLRLTEATVFGTIRMIRRPSFPLVVAYCWALNIEENPEDIYTLVEEDWESQ